MNTIESPLMNEHEAAAYLSLSVACLRAWRKNQTEDKPNFKKLGKCIRYAKSDLDQYLDRCTVRSGAAQ